jgi:2-hydroxy-3-keto-5-methylthiopentenyl-1-phosphate phosphatase
MKALSKASMAVVCDFDGTITLLDTAEFLLKKFAEGDWRAPDRLLLDGRISLEECMNTQCAMVRASRSEMLAALDGRVQLRQGFNELVDACTDNGIPFHVLSAGLDFIIKYYLERAGVLEKVTVTSPRAHWEHGVMSLRFPPRFHSASRSLKEDAVLGIKDQGREVVYIGDGLSDLDGARIADVRFAVSGRPLLGLLAREGLSATPFEAFGEVTASLGLAPAGSRE